jgi:hypothetical protein
MRKSVLIVAGILFVLVGLDRAGALVTGDRFDRGSAWANGWNGIDEDDSASEPDTAPPDISGLWGGTIDDSELGSGSFDVDFTQNGKKLTGTFSTSLGGSGNLTGSVSGSGKIHLKFLTPKMNHPKCHASSKGMVSTNTIALSFKFAGCGKNSGKEFGTIDLSNVI